VRLLWLPAVALAVALAVPAAAPAAAPFSHRLHLALKFACATCHPKAVSSARVEDNLLPDGALCRTCHKQVEIPPPAPTRVAKFSHAQHLKLGNVAPVLAAAIDSRAYLSAPGDIRRHLNGANACQACHRGLEESDRVSPAAMPGMADCLVCHNRIELPFSCEKCHARTDKLKPASHTPDFLDTHTSGKLGLDKATCAVCHGRKFTCLGCH